MGGTQKWKPKVFIASASAVLILSSLAVDTEARVNTAEVQHTTNKISPSYGEPVDIASRDLFHGPGGEAHVPRRTFPFKEEDIGRDKPKI
jgi:hypothetical protein